MVGCSLHFSKRLATPAAVGGNIAQTGVGEIVNDRTWDMLPA